MSHSVSQASSSGKMGNSLAQVAILLSNLSTYYHTCSFLTPFQLTICLLLALALPYVGHATQFLQSNNHSAKRSRTDAHSPQQEHGGPPPHELQQEVERQASEIATLKNEKTNMEHSYGQLKTEHEKVVQENKILKKAVTIQQERQSQTANELESARQYKVGAEEQIRKLEQIILSLRYHLQTQQSNPSFGNDFMGQFRPPDVY